MKYAAERQALIETALAMNHCGLNQGAAGNLSLRIEQGFLITPTGIPYDALVAADIVTVFADGHYEGEKKPSSEWRFHRDIYAARDEAGAVLHAHSAWCTTLACLQREIPAFHYMVAVAGGNNIRCAPYARFGTQALSDHALAALQDRRACLLAHHGMIALHDDLSKVLALATEVEHLARVYCQALQIGKPTKLDDAEMQRVLDKFKTYGQSAAE